MIILKKIINFLWKHKWATLIIIATAVISAFGAWELAGALLAGSMAGQISATKDGDKLATKIENLHEREAATQTLIDKQRNEALKHMAAREQLIPSNNADKLAKQINKYLHPKQTGKDSLQVEKKSDE